MRASAVPPRGRRRPPAQELPCGLYAAKEQVGPFAFFSSDMAEYARERMNLERHLAVATEKGEFPGFPASGAELSRRSLVGREALLRWRHPELGSGQPRALPSRWPSRPASSCPSVPGCSGPCLPSGRCLAGPGARPPGGGQPFRRPTHHSNFVQTVVEALGRHRLTPDLIELEITGEPADDGGGSGGQGTLDELARLRSAWH